MLKVENLNVFHGLIEAVHGINLAVPIGQCVALLGPNGAGTVSYTHLTLPTILLV